MKKMTIGFLLVIAAFSTVAQAQWECRARDSIGKKYSASGVSREQAKQRALENCRSYTSIGNCHFNGIDDCDVPSRPAFSCAARDAVGNEYKASGESKEQAKTRALENCRAQSNIGNCHMIGFGDCEANTTPPSKPSEPVNTPSVITTKPTAPSRSGQEEKLTLAPNTSILIDSNVPTRVSCSGQPTAPIQNTPGKTFNGLQFKASLVRSEVRLTYSDGTSQNLGCCIKNSVKTIEFKGKLYVFGVGEDHSVWYQKLNSDFVATGWISLGGSVNSIDSIALEGDDIAIYVTGSEGSAEYVRGLKYSWKRL